jgi:beta-galactosidase
MLGATMLGGLASAALAQEVTSIVPDGKIHTFTTRDKQFFIDGEPTLLVTGEMHFGRVLPEDWDLRIKQCKAMGLNGISFYLFWNLCEPREGEFVFEGMTDVRRMLELCRENGMWAVLRPGPYCCAEVEYGGIPAWTLKYPDVKIRTADPKFMEWCDRYIKAVYEQVGDLQVTRGGPLLMVQLDNEIGVIEPPNNDYLNALLPIFTDAGFDVPLFTCNPTAGGEWKDPAFRMPGIMHQRNGLKNDRMYEEAKEALGDYPVFIPEMYTSWFSGWSQPIATKNGGIDEIVRWTNYNIDRDFSFCYFMIFGGTTYGFYNGCLWHIPVITSYDYNAPIDEAGRTTEKYHKLRETLIERLAIAPPDPPADPAVIEIPGFQLTESAPLLSLVPGEPTRVADKPVAMEMLDQDYGFVLYRKEFPEGIKGTLELKWARDYTIVMVNGRPVARAFVGYGPDSNKVALDESEPVTLDLLVYNLGRISVPTGEATQNLARKGLIGGAWLDGEELTGDWRMFSLPFESVDNFKPSDAGHVGPTFYRGTFEPDEVGGSFLDMRDWGFGAVWVNGHNLGRHWDRGGIRSLFVPEHWLKAGKNEIVVLELHDEPDTPEVSGGTAIIEEPPVAFPVKIDTEIELP